jgi:hypothetical protein
MLVRDAPVRMNKRYKPMRGVCTDSLASVQRLSFAVVALLPLPLFSRFVVPEFNDASIDSPWTGLLTYAYKRFVSERYMSVKDLCL